VLLGPLAGIVLCVFAGLRHAQRRNRACRNSSNPMNRTVVKADGGLKVSSTRLKVVEADSCQWQVYIVKAGLLAG
jgi:hypothetical protein